MDDLISRQEAIDVIDKIFPADPMRNDYTQGITCGAALATEYIKQLSSAQPEPCEDAVSRDSVSKWLDRWEGYIDKDMINRMQYKVCDIPSVKPDIPTVDTPTVVPTCEDTISRQDAIRVASGYCHPANIAKELAKLPSAQPDMSEYSDKLWKAAYERGKAEAHDEIVRCKDCKHWRQQTNYQGALLSFGFCESDDMWRSLYGETYEVAHIDTDDDFYCGYAERKTDG